MNAYAAVALGDADVVLAGGAESMSNTPYLLLDARWGQKLGSSEVVDGMYRDGFLCPLCGQLMGETAETLADRHRISREESDRYALESQHRCERARKEGRFLAEVVPVEVQGRKGEVDRISTDEHPRDAATLDSLQKLAPVFRKGGTVHAGNSSGITDGAAAVVVLSEEKATGLGVEPMARIVGYASAGVDPAVMGIGPVPAVRKLLEKTGLRLEDIDLIELNEAFAAQVIACHRELGFDPERLNVNGGAIALGHPIGATGARIVVTLVHEMVRRKAKRGIATLCISGGMGLALLLESL
jgi:acetyl-CoA C-acetyltransferase